MAKMAAKEMAGAAKRKYMVEPPGMVRSMALLQVLFARWWPNARDCGVGANCCVFAGFMRAGSDFGEVFVEVRATRNGQSLSLDVGKVFPTGDYFGMTTEETSTEATEKCHRVHRDGVCQSGFGLRGGSG
jgi:hypothetical protein